VKRFTDLYRQLDETTKTRVKTDAMADYFRDTSPADAAWALHFLSGRRPKRLVGWGELRMVATEAANLREWLFEECYSAVGDLAETISLLVPTADEADDRPLAYWVESRLLPLRDLSEEALRRALLEAWRELDSGQTFVWLKLLTGAFRVGVSQKLVLRALESASTVDRRTLAHRLMGRWQPSAEAYQQLVSTTTADADVSRPYPFCLAHPLPGEPEELGDRSDWQAEWKWDGIRTQVVRRRGEVFIWSRGEELVTERFPDLAEPAKLLPDGTVLDGEIVGWSGEEPLPFGDLQRRINRKTVGRKLLAEVPVVLVAYDLLELGGKEVRTRPLAWRRSRLEQIVAGAPVDRVLVSPLVEAKSWSALATAREAARERGAEGLMLKRLDSEYHVGRRRGDWWKWKVDPYSVDAVLLYAQPGHGKRASLFTDYTFAVRDGDELVPIAKAYSGLSQAEIEEVDRFVRRNTRERFGPVRSVEPRLVFELHFEGIRRSTRHKSGIAVRFPRIARWRRDKTPADADALETVRELIDQ
jgi:DNA ligase-1